MQAFVKVVCRLEGADLTVKSSGEDALAHLQGAHPPHVVILDIGLPGISGWDVLTAIKKDPALTHCPVVVFSAYIDQDTRERAFEMGASGFLPKPIGARDFVEEISQYTG